MRQFINGLLVIVVGVALFPAVNQTVQDILGNTSGVEATILDVIPIFYAVAVLAGAAAATGLSAGMGSMGR